MIQSPLNYTGGKFKLLPQILPLFPDKIDCFVDLFCGGCNVGINVKANSYIYNDNCKPLIELYTVMKAIDNKDFVEKIESIICDYNLSNVKEFGYEYYNCKSSDGLKTYNKNKYLKLRSDFNNKKNKDIDYYIMLYVLIVYSFNNQIRFNKKGEFNLPPGKRDFNSRMKSKVIRFIDTIHKQNLIFNSCDFRNFNIENLNENDFVYIDPPYLITCAAYNEQGGWTENDEIDLLLLLDQLNNRNIKFALSNVLESKGKVNNILKSWIDSRPNYKLIDLNYSYKNSNYQRQNKKLKTREILIVNY